MTPFPTTALPPQSGGSSDDAPPPVSRLSELRPRTVWDVVDDALDAYRRRPALFASIAALLFVPYEIADTLLELAFYGPKGAGSGSGDSSKFFPYAFTSVPLLSLVAILVTAATAVALQDVAAGRPASLKRAYGQTLKRLGPLLGASLFYVLLTVLGAVFTLGIVSVVVMVRQAFIAQAVVLDGRGVRGAAARSRDLIQRDGARVFGLLALLALLILILQGAISGLMELASQFLPWLQAGDAATRQMREFVLDSVANSLGTIFLAPIAPLALTFFYWDLRVRREGLDIEAQAEEIGYPLAPDAFGQLPSERVVTLQRQGRTIPAARR
jgi:hypothetical protein